MIEEFFKLGFETLKKRKLRSWLTMLGIFVGIAAIVSLISLGQGLKNSIEAEFSKLGTDRILIQASGSFAPPNADISTAKLTKKDLETIRSTLGIKEAGGILSRGAKVEFNSQLRYQLIAGIPTDETFKLVKEFAYFKIEEGRDLKNGDMKKVVLGNRIAKGDMFKPNLKLRDRITINDIDFKVIGIYQPIGTSDDDSSIFISEDAFRELYNLTDEWSIIVAKTDGDPQAVAERIEKRLRKSRGVEEGKEDFAVTTAEEFISTFNIVLNILNVFLIGIASISLIVGGIGIMNTMYTSVLERTKEIGVMKAIGARNSDIGIIFMIESGLLGLAGGAIGVAIGIAIAKTVEYIIAETGNSLIKAIMPSWLVIGALMFSFLIGSISGTLPAYRASKMEPTEALRYE
jgi:putative ABC transport system permease protein